MSDQIETVSEQGLGSNIMDSIKGVAVGALLFVVSFVVLWVNEGRPDLGEVAKKSVAVSADSVDKSAEGKFVSVTGELKTDEKIGDPEFLAPGNYLNLVREVEMWAWVEKEDKKTEKKVGGSKKTKTTYTYTKEWTRDPKPPGKFEFPEGHENPPLTIESKRYAAEKAQVGAYPFQPSAAELPSGEKLALSDGMLTGLAKDPAAAAAEKPAGEEGAAATDDAAKPAGDDAAKADDGAKKDDAKADDGGGSKKSKKKKRSGRPKPARKLSPTAKADATDRADRRAALIAARKPDNFVRANDTYLFKGSGKLEDPQVGDVRVSFEALKPGGTVTLFGTLKDGKVEPYIGKDDVKLYRALKGSREEAIQRLSFEHKATTWILRLVGFLLMWFGLQMFFGPINTLLDIIPFLGSAGRFLIGVAMFPIALVLSIVTILLSIIAHSTILLILFLAGLGAGGFFLYKKKKRG